MHPSQHYLNSNNTVLNTRNLHRSGLTLVEVLVVLALIGILTTIVVGGVHSARSSAHRVQCASNMRQIGTALLSYTTDNRGFFPLTTHTARDGESWIYTLAPYLSDVDAVRICPADEPERQQRIRDYKATSYLLNDAVFAPHVLSGAARYDNVQWIPRPSQTLLSVISNRPISDTWDHTHSGEWNSWYGILDDVAVDRHRNGPRASNRLRGDANYLYADGRVENISASDWKSRYPDQGINPGAVPE